MMRCQCNSSAGSDSADTSLTLAGCYSAEHPATSIESISLKQAGSATFSNTLKAVAPHF
jgi:hypothetical protein